MISSVVLLFSISVAFLANAEIWEIDRSLPNVRQSHANPKFSRKISSLTDDLKSEFAKFKRKYGKVYESVEEENERFNNFILSQVEINNHNQMFEKGHKKFQMEINHMSDWTREEFNQLNSLKISNLTGSTYLPLNIKPDLPESFDWRDKGAVTEVKNQKYCGSCYAFSTTGALEGQLFRKTGNLISLSEQQIVDCDHVDYGCSGGLVPDALNYIKYSGGIESEQEYPYISGLKKKPNPNCNFKEKEAVGTDTGFVKLPPGDEEALREALVTIGPISIAFSATERFKHYKNGIYHDDWCSNVRINHAVLLVGYGTDEESGTPYWIIKNSWGPKWGESGYFRFERNKNMCNMAYNSYYPLV